MTLHPATIVAIIILGRNHDRSRLPYVAGAASPIIPRWVDGREDSESLYDIQTLSPTRSLGIRAEFSTRRWRLAPRMYPG